MDQLGNKDHKDRLVNVENLDLLGSRDLLVCLAKEDRLESLAGKESKAHEDQEVLLVSRDLEVRLEIKDVLEVLEEMVKQDQGVNRELEAQMAHQA